MQVAINVILMILMVVSALFAVLLISQGRRIHQHEQQAKASDFSNRNNATGTGHKN